MFLWKKSKPVWMSAETRSYSFNPRQVEAEILQNSPDIKQAHVSIEMPDALNIVIEERIPAILWYQNDEELFWIDQEGFTFTVRGEANLPIRVYSDTTPPESLGYIAPPTHS